jgi:hypothetical protein
MPWGGLDRANRKGRGSSTEGKRVEAGEEGRGVDRDLVPRRQSELSMSWMGGAVENSNPGPTLTHFPLRCHLPQSQIRYIM